MDGEPTFGLWLRQRRRMLDLTQAELARRVGCSEISIRKFEADERTPSRQIAELLAGCLEIPPAERAAFVAFARGRLPDDEDKGAAIAPAAPALARCADIPAPLTRLLGREQDVALIRELLLREDVRLLTLIGPPGIGKTRLSLEVAAELCHAHAFVDGVAFVALAPIGDPRLVITAIAQGLGVAESAGRSLMERLVEALRGRALLLVLDNFEHLLPAAPDLAHLLMACPSLKALATSRAALHLRGERLFPVAPLALPNMAWPLSLETVARSPAALLFVERTQAIVPDFALTGENAAVVAAICARLDGLPLAIELVAARSRLLSPLALLARLGQRLALLSGGPSDLPPRQQTLRNAIAWSYHLLDPTEQRLFERLGVFVGDYDLEAVEAVCGGQGSGIGDRGSGIGDRGSGIGDRGSGIGDRGSGIGDRGSDEATLTPDPWPLTPDPWLQAPDPWPLTPDPWTLASLVDKSLLQQVEQRDGEPRFRMLETIREYALERLAASGEFTTMRARHAGYYLGLAERAEPHLSGAQQDMWLDRLERDHDNLRAALAWSLQKAEGEESNESPPLHPSSFILHPSETGLRMCAALWRFWYTRCHLSDGRRWLMMALDQSRSIQTPHAASLRARALLGAGVLANAQGDQAEARTLLEESLALARRTGDQECLATALYHFGVLIFDQGEAELAIAAVEECLSIQQARGDTTGVASALNGLGNLLLGRDDARAVALFEQSVALQCELHNSRGIAFTLHSLGIASLRQRNYPHALRHFRGARRLFKQLGDMIGIADCLAGLAAVAGGRGCCGRAARLWQAAETLREQIGAPLPVAERAIYEQHLTGALPVLRIG